MTLAALIRKRESGKPATAIPATTATEGGNKLPSVARVATVAVARPQGDDADPFRAEARRQRVRMLADNPAIRYAITTDTEADPEAVILTLVIRDKATCELQIPRAKYDPFLLLHLIARHGETVH